MKVRWSPAASKDLEHIAYRIQSDNPAAARRIVTRIYERLMELPRNPYVGRKGEVVALRIVSDPSQIRQPLDCVRGRLRTQ